MIMVIYNATADSFYPPSRYNESAFVSGADIVDIGACSTRPGSVPVSEEEEWIRLEPVLHNLVPAVDLSLPGSVVPGRAQFRHRNYPEGKAFALSIDTFRPGIVRRSFELLDHPFIVNDVGGSAGEIHIKEMAELCRSLELPYVATHNGPASETIAWFAGIAPLLDGVDWILDPGLGFGKDTPEENWALLELVPEMKRFGRPVLIGASHKRFTNGTSELTRRANEIAARGGADIFRVHDVADAQNL